jgi:endoglucanase
MSPLPVDRAKEPPHVTVLPIEQVVFNSQNDQLLVESWQAYRERFIQADGRVIDWESDGRTVSEGQAYAMLRAVLIDDPQTFEITLKWAEENLKRSPQPHDTNRQDQLWSWLWGKRADGSWGILDSNFASDADIDAITALILASKQWHRPDYLDLAYQKLEDLWNQSTVVPLTLNSNRNRYLLPGPLSSFQVQPGKIYLNPSYFAPYAFRLFAANDPNPDHDWMQLVDGSYEILTQTKQLSQDGLPGNWVVLDLTNQMIQPTPPADPLQSQYGFDAYRIWWRIAWDAALSDDGRAQDFLASHLPYFQNQWQVQGRIPAVISLAGQPLVDYEATSQYAMLYAAFQQFDPAIADSIRTQKLLTTYEKGIWDDPNAYYVQNLAWLGIFPTKDVESIFGE